MHSMGQVLLAFFRKKFIWLYILFILCYRLTEGLALKMVPIFLKASREQGGLALSNEEIGTLYGIFGTVAFIVGSILGGYYIADLVSAKCSSRSWPSSMCHSLSTFSSRH